MVFPRNGRFDSKIMALWLRKMMTKPKLLRNLPSTPWPSRGAPPTKTCLVLSYDSPVVFSEGAVPVARVGYQSHPNISQHFQWGAGATNRVFHGTWWTMAMMTEGEGPQPWAMGISCAPTGTRRLACEKWWEDGDKRCVLEGCSCAWADSCWFWALFLKILACHFCNMRLLGMGNSPGRRRAWPTPRDVHWVGSPDCWKTRIDTAIESIKPFACLWELVNPNANNKSWWTNAIKCIMHWWSLIWTLTILYHIYWCLADRLIRLGFSIALRPTLSVCAWCQGANTKAWVDSVALSQPKLL